MSPPDNHPGRTYGGETQAVRKARRRSQFIDAGLEVFGTVGYRQATVRQLCRQARLTDRYFYEEFGSAEDLLVSVYLDCIECIRARVIHALIDAGQAPVEALVRAALDGFFAGIEDARIARVVWLEVLGVSPRVDQTYMDCVRGFADLLMKLAKTAHSRLSELHDLQHMTAVGLVGAVSEAAKHWSLGDYCEPRSAIVDATLPLFLGMAQYLSGLHELSRPKSS